MNRPARAKRPEIDFYYIFVVCTYIGTGPPRETRIPFDGSETDTTLPRVFSGARSDCAVISPVKLTTRIRPTLWRAHTHHRTFTRYNIRIYAPVVPVSTHTLTHTHTHTDTLEHKHVHARRYLYTGACNILTYCSATQTFIQVPSIVVRSRPVL